MTLQAFIQKTCIWALSLMPFAFVSLTAMPGHGPLVTGASLLAIFYCMLVLALCMNLALQWSALWDLQDREDDSKGASILRANYPTRRTSRAPRIGSVDIHTLKPTPRMSQAEIAQRIAQGRFAEMSLD